VTQLPKSISTIPTCGHCHQQHDPEIVCAAARAASQPYPVDIETMIRCQTELVPTGPLYWPERARMTLVRLERSMAEAQQKLDDFSQELRNLLEDRRR